MKAFFDIAKKVAGKVASKLTGKVAKDIATQAAKAIEKVQKMLEAKQPAIRRDRPDRSCEFRGLIS